MRKAEKYGGYGTGMLIEIVKKTAGSQLNLNNKKGDEFYDSSPFIGLHESPIENR